MLIRPDVDLRFNESSITVYSRQFDRYLSQTDSRGTCQMKSEAYSEDISLHFGGLQFDPVNLTFFPEPGF